jgi:exopolyphosphatase/guanosine-5'-triphosphate,3'-diphosphate pyrophosphatase
VSRLLGREPDAAYTVVARRRDGTPAVIENAPFLSDGRPMPTRFWLVDAALREAVSRLEADGGVRRAAAVVPPEEVAAAHLAHAAARDRLIPAGHTGPLPSGGVGGTRRGVKCLHAHLAWYLAGGDDPVGRWTAEQLGVERDTFLRDAAGDDGPVAAVDCGTNSTRLLVVDGARTTLAREMRITRLGEGVDATGSLAHDAIDRTLSVLRDYRETMDRCGVSRARVVATSAARDAENADAFMSPTAAIMGVRPEVLSGDEEGRLSFAGATANLTAEQVDAGPVLVVDIGGGSTEFSVGHPGAASASAEVSTRSLDIGCVRVTERFLRHDPPRRGELAQARHMVEREVAAVRDVLPALEPDSLLVGLAGTVSTLASLEYALTHYERARIHHAVLGRAVVEHWLELLAAEPASDRLGRPGMVQGREDVIVGGVLILAVVMEQFACGRCLVSEDDILDGLAATLLDT